MSKVDYIVAVPVRGEDYKDSRVFESEEEAIQVAQENDVGYIEKRVWKDGPSYALEIDEQETRLIEVEN